MKKYLLITVIFIVFGCTKQQQDNSIVIFYNYTVQEPLLIDTDSLAFLTESLLDFDRQDSTKMYKLDRNTIMQLKKIINMVYYEYIIAYHNGYGKELFLNNDSLNTGINFFLYGKLNLQPDINSLVLWEFDRDTELNVFHNKYLWLLNIRANKLCSVMQLAYFSETYTDPPTSYSKTYLKNGIFTTIKKTTESYSFPENILIAAKAKGKGKLFTCYQVNEEGFIEFLKY
jgi:hypothetical protein